MRPLDAALKLIAQGLHCLPCADNKRPTCPNGFYDATTNPEALRALWATHPGPLVAVRTGKASDFTVLDIDPKHSEARSWWAENRERLPTTRTHRTRSGGLHLLFRYVSGLKCSASKIAPGIDIRSEGGYVIWWPAHGCPVLNDAPIADAPDWLIDALRPPPPPIRPKVSPISVNGIRRVLQGLIRTVVTASEGERNRITFWAACRAAEMIEAGHLTEGEAVAELTAASAYAGLPECEAVRTIQSGLGSTKKK
jgi:bifunctional DNA primase/polymerase-like protein